MKLESGRLAGATADDISRKDSGGPCPAKIAEPVISAEAMPVFDFDGERAIQEADELLINNRTLDNSAFKGRETTWQQNDTLDIIEQVKRSFENDKECCERLELAGIDINRLNGKNMGRPGIGPLKCFKVLKKTGSNIALIRGRSLYIYQLRLLRVFPPDAQMQPGTETDLIWPVGKEKAVLTVRELDNKLENKPGLGLIKKIGC
jgi:hypothetical protein